MGSAKWRAIPNIITVAYSIPFSARRPFLPRLDAVGGSAAGVCIAAACEAGSLYQHRFQRTVCAKKMCTALFCGLAASW